MENHHSNKNTRVRGAFYKPFSKERVRAIKRLIENFESQEKVKHYSILVDGEMVVPKGSNSESFDDYETFLDEHTERVEIRLYQGESPNFKLHVFDLKEQPSLNGLGSFSPQTIEEHVAKALEKRELEMELDNLRRELKRKTKKLRKYKENDDSSGIDLNGIVTKGFELFGNLNKKELPSETPIQGLATSELEIESEKSESEKYFSHLKKRYSEKELIYAVRLWELLIQHPDLHQEFKTIINSKIEKNGEAHN